jgi:hypothetical protein
MRVFGLSNAPFLHGVAEDAACSGLRHDQGLSVRRDTQAIGEQEVAGDPGGATIRRDVADIARRRMLGPGDAFGGSRRPGGIAEIESALCVKTDVVGSVEPSALDLGQNLLEYPF